MSHLWNPVNKIVNDSASASSHGVRAPIVPAMGSETQNTSDDSATSSHGNNNINDSATRGSHGARAPIVPAMGSETQYTANASAASSHGNNNNNNNTNDSVTPSSHCGHPPVIPAPESKMPNSSNASAAGSNSTLANGRESLEIAAAQALTLLSSGAFKLVPRKPMTYAIRNTGNIRQPCRPYGPFRLEPKPDWETIRSTPPKALAKATPVSKSAAPADTPEPPAKSTTVSHSTVPADTPEALEKTTAASKRTVHAGTPESPAKITTASNSTAPADTPEALAGTTTTSNRKGPRQLKATFKNHNQPTITEHLSTDGTATYTRTTADGSTETKKYGGSCPRRVCGWSFTSKSHLKRHMESCGNPDYKPNGCPVPKCDYQCSRRDNLRQHIENIHPTLERGVRQEELDEVRRTLAKKEKANWVDVLLERTNEDWRRVLRIILKLPMPKRKRAEEKDAEEVRDPKVVRQYRNQLGWLIREIDDRDEAEQAGHELFESAAALAG